VSSERPPHAAPESYLARGFRDVDAAAAEKMAHCLRYLDSLPAFREYKARILEFLSPRAGSTAVDLGCGLGFDVRRLAELVGPKGKAIGVDLSHSLLLAARSASEEFPNTDFIQANIRQLPFRDGGLDACKIDRVLQHVERPETVIEEIFRILHAGGKVVCAEPDWSTFFIDTEPSPIAQQIARNWSASFQNPRMGGDLRDRLEKAGFNHLQTAEQILSTVDFDSSNEVFDIAQTAMRLAASSGSSEPAEWIAKIRDGREPIRCAVTLVIHSAQKP
jgi:ubiquinone/menaquinone biosynthesis C-methylase UbiE